MIIAIAFAFVHGEAVQALGFRLEANKKKTCRRKNSSDADGEGMVTSWRSLDMLRRRVAFRSRRKNPRVVDVS